MDLVALELPLPEDSSLRVLIAFFVLVFCVGTVALLAGAAWTKYRLRNEPPSPPPPWPRRHG